MSGYGRVADAGTKALVSYFFSLKKRSWSLDVSISHKEEEIRREMAQNVGKSWTSNRLCYFLDKPVYAFWLQFRRKGSGTGNFIIRYNAQE